MSISDLVKKENEAAKTRTPEERAALLKKAHILDDDGFFCEGYFSEETINKSKEMKHASTQ